MPPRVVVVSRSMTDRRSCDRARPAGHACDSIGTQTPDRKVHAAVRINC